MPGRGRAPGPIFDDEGVWDQERGTSPLFWLACIVVVGVLVLVVSRSLGEDLAPGVTSALDSATGQVASLAERGLGPAYREVTAWLGATAGSAAGSAQRSVGGMGGTEYRVTTSSAPGNGAGTSEYGGVIGGSAGALGAPSR